MGANARGTTEFASLKCREPNENLEFLENAYELRDEKDNVFFGGGLQAASDIFARRCLSLDPIARPQPYGFGIAAEASFEGPLLPPESTASTV